MKLKKLEIFGFKSFHKPTEIHFHEGTTVIVGPNGCGKSNIIDAIRWVMGETSAKGLRGDSMGDVIFAGSEARKPLNLAEVTLTLTGTEGKLHEKFGNFHEVAITRRLHRSGESEYLINKVPCRLKDIMELFMDTGVGRRAYSVIEQGRIEAILNAKPFDRRALIEEAAGLTKYRSRREETLRKIEHTSQNLLRVDDLLSEMKRDMNSLKRQASRAEAYKRLRATERELERELLIARWLSLDSEFSDITSAHCEVSSALDLERANISKAENVVEQRKLGLLAEEKSLEQKQQTVYGLKNRISEREARLQFLSNEVESLQERSTKSKQESADLKVRGETLDIEIEQLQKESIEVKARIEGRSGGLASMTEAQGAAAKRRDEVRITLEEEKRELLKTLNELTRVNHGLDHSHRQASDIKRRLELAERQAEELSEKSTEADSFIEQVERDLEKAREGNELAREDRERLRVEIEDATEEHERLTGEVGELSKKLSTAQSKLTGLEELEQRLAWYDGGVQAILKEVRENDFQGVRCVVADTITVPARYEAALEASLGSKLQVLVVDDPAKGAEAVGLLKNSKSGRSSFAPVEARNGLKTKFPSSGDPGVHGPLLDMVKVEPGYEKVAHALLGDVFVVETLDQALGLWSKNGTNATLVTLDGDTVHPSGLVTGGAGSKESGGLLKKNREIKELKKSVANLSKSLASAEKQMAHREAMLAESKKRFEAARDELHTMEIKVTHLSRDLEQATERRERLQERLDAGEFEKTDLAETGKQFADDAERYEAEKKTLLLKKETVEERLENLQASLDEASVEADKLGEELTRLRVEEASDRQREVGLAERITSLSASRENVLTRAERLSGEAEQYLTHREGRSDEALSIKAELTVLSEKLEKSDAELTTVVERLDQCRTEVGEAERVAQEARRKAEELRTSYTNAEIAQRDLEMQRNNLKEKYADRVGGDICEGAVEGLKEGFNHEEITAEIIKIQEKIRTFGEINLLAVEQYEERKERFEFVSSQKADLEESLDSLRNAINRINRISRERFGDTFEKVNETFQRVFPQLFQGGKAKLVLTDPDNLLETGVDIVAHPSGKRPQHISLLSGGEKAMTAVALIFSIFLVKPSPFCILDEVDAPLDDANVGRFTDIIHELAETSQFLIITHNKVTMEGADHLYGVTMTEPGVSRLVSVRMNNIAPQAAA